MDSAESDVAEKFVNYEIRKGEAEAEERRLLKEEKRRK